MGQRGGAAADRHDRRRALEGSCRRQPARRHRHQPAARRHSPLRRPSRSPFRSACSWARCAPVETALDPILQVFRQTSALALYPVFILLLGLGETSKIFVIFWATLFPLLLNTTSGVKEVDPEAARNGPRLWRQPAHRISPRRAAGRRAVDLRRPAAERHHGAAASDRLRDDRRQQGHRLPGDERAVQFPDPADVCGNRHPRRARPDRQPGAGRPAAAALPLEQSIN